MTKRSIQRARWWRRALAMPLAAMGIALMLLSPSVGLGLAAFALGIALEAVGLLLEHHRSG